MGMLGSMLHRRAIAAKCYAAFLAGAQVQPGAVNFDTFLAYIILRLPERLDGEQVFADLIFHVNIKIGCFGIISPIFSLI